MYPLISKPCCVVAGSFPSPLLPHIPGPLFIPFQPFFNPQLDRRTLLDNLALVLLSIDELVDAGRILEIDPSAIASRVLMRGADARGPQNPDLTFQQVRAGCRVDGA